MNPIQRIKDWWNNFINPPMLSPLGPNNPKVEAYSPPTPQPSPTGPQFKAPEGYQGYYFDSTPYGYQIPQPNQEEGQLLRDYYPDEATKAAVTAFTESGYNPKASYTNTIGRSNGTKDLGLMMINTGKSTTGYPSTFDDYMRRMPAKLKAAGINNYADMLDIIKNLEMSRIIREYQGWDAWMGPKNNGFDLSK